MFIFLLILYLIFAGGLTFTNTITGIVIAGLITVFCHYVLGYSTKKFILFSRNITKAIKYLVFLLIEIFKSNISVVKYIFSKKEIKPQLVKFNGGLRSEVGRVLFANSITLTPGTITVSLDGDNFLVHALDKSLANGIEECDFQRKCKELEE